MNLTQVFLDQLGREAVRTRRALESVPKGKDDWTPHSKRAQDVYRHGRTCPLQRKLSP
jgi:hypothetical protein